MKSFQKQAVFNVENEACPSCKKTGDNWRKGTTKEGATVWACQCGTAVCGMCKEPGLHVCLPKVLDMIAGSPQFRQLVHDIANSPQGEDSRNGNRI